jgi:hypothetical protein
MKYKEMKVWSAGENAKTKKIELIMGSIIFVGWIVLCILFFTQNMNDDKTVVMKLWEHILCGICMSGLTSIVGFVGYATITLSIDAIKRNKEITIQLYEFNEFMKLGGVPDNKVVVYSDTCGFVICDKENEREYHDWQGSSKKDLYFFKFKEFYEKYKGYKTEICL